MELTYPLETVVQAMKQKEVILKAMAGQYSWLVAADILRMSPRNLRRLRFRYQKLGIEGLFDRRTGKPSPKRAPYPQVEKVLRLFREKYSECNMRHFHEIAQREHGVTLSYSWTKKVLHEAGLVKKQKGRKRHRLRRERKAAFGEMLHLDGSLHAWLALCPDQKQVLISVPDDATGRVLHAELFEVESTQTVMTAMKAVVETYGIPLSWYTDRAGWAFETPKAGEPVDKETLTQVGRALHQLGIEHIPSYSPQARGRMERLNRTFQDRLVNELRLAGIRTVPSANAYIVQTFLSRFNERFAVPPRESHVLFVAAKGVDLEAIFCEEFQRVVAKDNTVHCQGQIYQVPPQKYRPTCAGLRVLVRKHLDGRISIWRGPTCLIRFGTGHPDSPVGAQKVLSPPNLASSTPEISLRGRDRRLSKSPGLSFLSSNP